MVNEITAIPSIRSIHYDTYANLPTTNVAAGDLGYATDREVLYRWSGAAWQPVTKYAGAGAYGDIPTAADLPDGSLYFATDRLVTYQVQTAAWAAITLYTGYGAYGDIPTAADLPNGSMYYATDQDKTYQVQAAAWAAWLKGATLTVTETQVHTGAAPTAYTDLDLSAVIGAQKTLVILKVKTAGAYCYAFRQNGDTDSGASGSHYSACTLYSTSANIYGLVVVHTDASGIVEWLSSNAAAMTVDVVAYIKG
ncbi:hypothetical protein ACFLYS_01760 [Chloroflexota bacterium]